MIFRITRLPLLILFLIAISCTKDLESEMVAEQNSTIEQFLKSNSYNFKYENGVYYAIDSIVYGYKVATGDSLQFWYVAKTLSNQIFDTNIKSVALANNLDTLFRTFRPIRTVAGTGNLVEGVKRGLLLARGKQKGKVLFASNLGFGGNEFGPVPAWSPLVYDIQIVSVSNANIKLEMASIANYLNTASPNFAYFNEGFWLGLTVQGTGNQVPANGCNVYAWCKISKLNGELVYRTANQNELFSLTPNNTMLGLVLSLTKLKVGDVAFILLPSPLTSGPQKYDEVYPYTPLICEVRIDSLKVNN